MTGARSKAPQGIAEAQKAATAISALANALCAVVDEEDRTSAITLAEDLFERARDMERLLDAMPLKIEEVA